MWSLSENRRMALADFVLLCVAAIWGGGFVAGKFSLSGLTPIAILMYRFTGAALILGLFFFKRIKGDGRKVVKYGCILGSIQFFALLIQLVGLQYTTPAKQSFLAATYAVLTPLIVWWTTKVRPQKKDALAALLALAGIALISLNSALEIQMGDFITIGFASVFSLQIVLTARYVKSVDAIALTFYQFFFSALLSVAAVIVTGTDIACTAGESMGGVIYLALVNTALAICLQNIAQRYTKESHTALLLSLESVFGFLFSVLIYKEKITLQIMTGCIFVLAALLVSRGLLKFLSHGIIEAEN